MAAPATRLKKFMETVEKATDSIPPSVPTPPENGNGAAEVEDQWVAPQDTADTRPSQQTAAKRTTDSEAGSSAVAEQAWADVFSAGATLLESFGRAMASGASDSSTDGPPCGLPAGLVARDEATGRSYLKLPMPEPEVAQKIVDVIGALMKGK